VLVGAGSFGEHRFAGARADDENIAVQGTYVEVALAPASQIELALGLERYCQAPSFREPWHGAGIPYR
jgi:ABC-type proline/glycine betaine transport system permease subunit